MSQEKLRQNVLAIIFDNEANVLIVSRANDPLHWQFPQGGIGDNEDAKTALLRELQEELHCNDFTILAECPEKHIYHWAKKLIRDENLGQEQTIFLVKFTGNTQSIQVDKRELGGFLWVPQNKIEVFLHEYRKPVWHIALKHFPSEKINQLLTQ
jgi:putative (di)nucleoside polyphosphate hydrolase